MIAAIISIAILVASNVYFFIKAKKSFEAGKKAGWKEIIYEAENIR